MTENNDKRLHDLFQRYLANRISEEEFLELWKLMPAESGKDILSDELQSLWESRLPERPRISKKQWDEKIQQMIRHTEMSDHKTAVVHKISSLKWIAASAAVVVVIAAGIFLYHRLLPSHKAITVNRPKQEDNGISPGGNKAVLILSNGSRIMLDSTANGVITKQGKTSIIKSGNGQIAYNPTSSGPESTVYNMLSTPRGGKYRITLPDGTKVWLNAASTLRFPTSFTGNERVVEMTGEAYFEVAGDAAKPFIVSVDGMQVKVLGTHFNIMAYDDEPTVKTTLLEGAVNVQKGTETVALKPGQQARMNKEGKIMVVKNANTDEVVAWKNDLFWFHENSIQEVMRRVSRWYDADVVIKGNISRHFTGSIPRDVNIMRVFQVLQETGNIHFKVENHKIIVTP